MGEQVAAGPGQGAAAGEGGVEHNAGPVALPKVYAGLPPAEASKAHEIALRIRHRGHRFQIEVGRDLIAAKELLKHGRFSKWLKTELGWSERSAQNWMGAARLAQDKPEIVAVLPPTALYALAAPGAPAAVVEKILNRASAGEPATVTEIRRQINDARLRERNEAFAAKRFAKVSKKKRCEIEQARQAQRDRWERDELRRNDAAAEAASIIIAALDADSLTRLRALLGRTDGPRLVLALAPTEVAENLAAGGEA